MHIYVHRSSLSRLQNSRFKARHEQTAYRVFSNAAITSRCAFMSTWFTIYKQTKRYKPCSLIQICISFYTVEFNWASYNLSLTARRRNRSCSRNASRSAVADSGVCCAVTAAGRSAKMSSGGAGPGGDMRACDSDDDELSAAASAVRGTTL